MTGDISGVGVSYTIVPSLNLDLVLVTLSVDPAVATTIKLA